MKYVVAISIVCLIIGLALRFTVETRREVRNALREALKSPEVQALLSEEEKQSMSEGSLDGLGTELPGSLVIRIQCCDLLRTFWFIWIPLTLGFGLAIVTFWPNAGGNASETRPPVNSTAASTKSDR